MRGGRRLMTTNMETPAAWELRRAGDHGNRAGREVASRIQPAADIEGVSGRVVSVAGHRGAYRLVTVACECGAVHLHRLPAGEAAAVRRGPCGRRYEVTAVTS